MPPPYANSWNYFRADAFDFIKANRTWTTADRNNTVSTIWAGVATVRAHYDAQTFDPNGARTALSPGLPIPNPIPIVPYTHAHALYAKQHRALPALAAPAVPAPPPAPAPAPLPVPVPIPVPAPAPAPLPALASAPGYVSSQLHDFWPRLPWSPEPLLPPFHAKDITGDELKKKAWLGTQTYMPPPSEAAGWRGVRLLGSGGYGAAGLWVQIDAANNIRDRMVIKETNTMDASQWRDPKNWRDRLPREIRIHELVEERRNAEPDSCRHLIHCRGHRLWMQLRRYRIYLDFHTGGDLFHAMEPYRKNWSKRTRKKDCKNDVFVPEGFVWYVLKALATACLVLQKGTVSGGEVAGWKPITHLDIHQTNTLLNVPIKIKKEPLDELPGEPSGAAAVGVGGGDEIGHGPVTDSDSEPPFIPILTDFGLSFFSPESHGCPISDNPEDFMIRVYPRYPPELHQQQGPPYAIKLGEKTDVWSIGNIAWALITNSRAEHGPVFCNFAGGGSAKFAPFNDKVPVAITFGDSELIINEHNLLSDGCIDCRAANKYTPRIKDLVRRCVSFGQEGRPLLTEIIAQANEVLVDCSPEMNQLMDKSGFHFKLPDSGGWSIGKRVF